MSIILDFLINSFFILLYVIFGFFLIFGLILLWWLFKSVLYGFLIRLLWYPKGKRSLFVYSDSPNWKEYIDKNILPKISTRAVVINWSERSKWEKSKRFELKIFQHWTGVVRYFDKGKRKWDGSEFCPIAIVFIPWWNPKVIRFWQAFKDFKHDKDLKLKKCELELFQFLK